MNNDPVRRRHLRVAQERLRRLTACYEAIDEISRFPIMFIALLAIGHWKHPPLSVQIAFVVLFVAWSAGSFAFIGIFFVKRSIKRNS